MEYSYPTPEPGQVFGGKTQPAEMPDMCIAASLLYVLPRGAQLLVLVRARASVRVRAKVRVRVRGKVRVRVRVRV